MAMLHLLGCRAAQYRMYRQGKLSNRSQGYKIMPVRLEMENFSVKCTVHLSSFSYTYSDVYLIWHHSLTTNFTKNICHAAYCKLAQ